MNKPCSRSFVWQQRTITKGKREFLPFLSRLKIDTSLSASARGINDSGVVTGFTSTHAGTNDGFVGNDALGYQRLVAPGGEMPGNSTICEGINNFDLVSCGVNDADGNLLAAFIGSPVEGKGKPRRTRLEDTLHLRGYSAPEIRRHCLSQFGIAAARLFYCLKKLPFRNVEKAPGLAIGAFKYATPNSIPAVLPALPGSKLSVADSPGGMQLPTGFMVIVPVPPLIE